MALVESTETSYFEDFVKRGDKDEIIKTSKMKITKRVYPCRPQVNERRTWAKFG